MNLILMGEKPETARQSAKILSDIAGQSVEVEPYTTDPERKQEILRRAHLVIMPSRAESFGLVATEALSAGIPAMGPNTCGYGLFLSQRFPTWISDRMWISAAEEMMNALPVTE